MYDSRNAVFKTSVVYQRINSEIGAWSLVERHAPATSAWHSRHIYACIYRMRGGKQGLRTRVILST